VAQNGVAAAAAAKAQYQYGGAGVKAAGWRNGIGSAAQLAIAGNLAKKAAWRPSGGGGSNGNKLKIYQWQRK